MADANSLRQAMLAALPDKYDKSEGGLFYDVLAPVAAAVAELSGDVDTILDRRFLDSALGEDLDRATSEIGIERKSAAYASGTITLTGAAGTSVTAGALVASTAAQFMLQSDATIPVGGTVDVSAVCTTAGTIGNVGASAITRIPVTIAGITAVTNAAAFTGGADRESDDALRTRAYLKTRTPGTSGNKNDYVNWALSVSGVGGAKVTPLWNGNGTVKVVITDEDGEAANAALVSAVTAYIETVRPIGAAVTVAAATETTITVAATIALQSGYTRSTVDAAISAAITDYFRAFKLAGTAVSYARIGAIILGVAGVSDYTALTVNSGSANVAIAANCVPKLGGFTDNGT